MRLALVSDTHHSTPFIPDGVDGVIFAGDFCCTHRSSKAVEIERVVWEKIYTPYLRSIRERGITVYGIPGNHDYLAETDYIDEIAKLFDVFMEKGEFVIEKGDEHLRVFAYCYHHLENFPFYKLDVKMFTELGGLCDKIRCDILITHSPPFGLFDKGREHWGSHAIRDFVTVIRPQLHVFGHVHEARGYGTYGTTTYVNASCVSEDSKLPIGNIYVYDTVKDTVEDVETREWRVGEIV